MDDENQKIHHKKQRMWFIHTEKSNYQTNRQHVTLTPTIYQKKQYTEIDIID